MDAPQFDRLVLTLTRTGTRRSVLGLLTALGVSGLVPEEALAACADNGKRCDRATDAECCSGRCVRKRGTNKKFCRAAFSQGICTIEDNFCTLTGTSTCAPSCLCRLTIDGQSYCSTGGDCTNCSSHKECQERFGSKGARCTPLGTTCCGGGPGNECSLKCPNPD
jgi:hypothetical protein